MSLFSGRPLVAAVSVAFVGACLGFWMFSLRGMFLFAGIGACLTVALDFLPPRATRASALLALTLAAVALRSASTLGWGAADAPDGTRYKASPVGLSHVLTPHQTVSETINCGWWAASGYRTLCKVAPGGQSAFRRLRAVYPLVIVAAVCCVLAAMLSVMSAPLVQGYRRWTGACATLAATFALALFAISLRPALADLQSLVVSTGGTLGTMEMTAALLLCIATSIAPAGRPSRRVAV